LEHKFRALSALGVEDVDGLYKRFTALAKKSAADIQQIYDFELKTGR
jgi:hypothetical protein